MEISNLKGVRTIGKTKKILGTCLICYYLIISLFPPIYYYLPISASTLRAIFWIASIILFPREMKGRSMLVLYIYIGLLALHFFLGSQYFSTINSFLIPLLNFGSAILIGAISYKYLSPKYIKVIVYVAIIIIILIIIISIPSLMINPNIIRGASVNAVDADEFLMDLYYWVIDYGTVHQLFILIPLIVFIIREERSLLINFFWFMSFTFIIYITYAANAGTVFVLGVILLFFSLWIKAYTINREILMRIFIVVMFLLVIHLLGIIPVLIGMIQDVTPSDAYLYEKLEEIKTLLVSGQREGDLDARGDLYSTSLMLFLESPIWGTSDSLKVGDHTFIIDQLALLGICGVIPLYYVFKLHLSMIYKSLEYTRFVFILAIIAYCMMLLLKHSFGYLFIFGLLPIFCQYGEIIYIDKIKKNNK